MITFVIMKTEPSYLFQHVMLATVVEFTLWEANDCSPNPKTDASLEPCNFRLLQTYFVVPTLGLCKPINEEEKKKILGDFKMSLSSLVFISFHGCPICFRADLSKYGYVGFSS